MMQSSTTNLVKDDVIEEQRSENRTLARASSEPGQSGGHTTLDLPEDAPKRARSYGTLDNAPPNYEEPRGPPPSYDSLIARLKRAKQEEHLTPWGFIKHLFAEIFASIVWTIVLMLLVVLPICMVVMGSKYINDCPRQPSIPIMLVVGGALMVVSNLLSLGDRCFRMHDPSPRPSITVVGGITSLLNCLCLGWFIASCVWVYGIYLPVFDMSYGRSQYCNPVLYYFAFWLLNAFYLFFGVLFVIGLFGLCCSLIF